MNTKSIHRKKEFIFNNIKQLNRNRLLWDTSIHVDGIKTGHLSEVEYNLVASAINDKNGMRLISVVIGDVSEKARAQDSLAILRYGMRFYEPYSPIKAGQSIVTKEVRLGDKSLVNLGVNVDPYFAIPVNSQKRIKAQFTVNNQNLKAPIKKGEKLGTLSFVLAGKTIYQLPLVSLDEINEGGFFSKTWDHVVMTVSGWF